MPACACTSCQCAWLLVYLLPLSLSLFWRPRELHRKGGPCIPSLHTLKEWALAYIKKGVGPYVNVMSFAGVPSTKEYTGCCNLHHTPGDMNDMSQEVDCYKPVTCYQTILRTFVDARYLIDKAFAKALMHRKPVLLEVCRYSLT